MKIPKNQKLWVTYYDKTNNPIYLITSDTQRTKYFLYSIDGNGELNKIETSAQPIFKKIKEECV